MTTTPDPSPSDEARDTRPRKKMRGGWRSRPLWLGMALGLLVVPTVYFLFVLVTREKTTRLTQADFDAAVQRWETAGLAGHVWSFDELFSTVLEPTT